MFFFVQVVLTIIFLYFLFLLDPEIIDTFDRAEYRQSGSSLDSNNDKKKKNQKLFKGFGMFKLVFQLFACFDSIYTF